MQSLSLVLSFAIKGVLLHWRVWLTIICMSAVLVASCLLWLFKVQRPLAVRSSRSIAMQMAWMELLAYDSMHNSLPANAISKSGETLSSWRFIAAYMYSIDDFGKEDAIKINKDARWDSPENSFASKNQYYCYCSNAPWDRSDALETKILAIAGRDAGFDPQASNSLKNLPNDLILLIQVSNTGIHWMEPGDYDLDNNTIIPTNGYDGRGCFVAFVDGAVWFIRKDVPQDILRKFCTIDSACIHDRSKLLAPFAKEYCSSWLQQSRSPDSDPAN